MSIQNDKWYIIEQVTKVGDTEPIVAVTSTTETKKTNGGWVTRCIDTELREGVEPISLKGQFVGYTADSQHLLEQFLLDDILEHMDADPEGPSFELAMAMDRSVRAAQLAN